MMVRHITSFTSSLCVMNLAGTVMHGIHAFAIRTQEVQEHHVHFQQVHEVRLCKDLSLLVISSRSGFNKVFYLLMPFNDLFRSWRVEPSCVYVMPYIDWLEVP